MFYVFAQICLLAMSDSLYQCISDHFRVSYIDLSLLGGSGYHQNSMEIFPASAYLFQEKVQLSTSFTCSYQVPLRL